MGKANMTDVFFESSDSVRSAGPLKHVQNVTFDEAMQLQRGGRLESVTVAYETYGQLNEARDNAVLICHALSGDSHVARHNEQDDPGWWDIVVGPASAIDTDRYFVICPNILGGCRGSTGPSTINPATGKPYGRDFPVITIGDMVEVQRRLADHLGINKLLAVVGGSMGGHQAMQWSTAYHDRVGGTIAMATSPRLSSQALAFDVVGRNAIVHDPNFRDGQYYDNGPMPDVGLAIARMIGHITYLSPQAMGDKFDEDRNRPRNVPVAFEKEFSVGSYLSHKGTEFVGRFDANSYITLSMAMDMFDMGTSPGDLRTALRAATCRWLIISFTSDWLFASAESRQIVEALASTGKAVSYCDVNSRCGHDAFLLPSELESYGHLIAGFLANLSGRTDQSVPHCEKSGRSPTSIFHPDHPHRLDESLMLELIEPSDSVLDLGCGDGALMADLARRGNTQLVGAELDEQAIVSCVRRGLNVVHMDLNEGLGFFADEQFDVIVLSHTLQSIRDVEGLIAEMLRVGRRCVVSFPNFAYHKLGRMLTEQGRAPEAAGLLHHKWYNSPNIRFFSITDFEEFCDSKAIKVHRRIALNTEQHTEVHDDANKKADMAIFVLSK